FVAGHNFGAAPIPNEQLSPQFVHAMQIFMSIFTLIVFVLAPLIFIIFYTRRSVKATCQPTLSVTEQSVPTAIWVLVVLLVLHALALLWTAAFFPAVAFFGVFLTGWAARVVLIILTAVWVWLGWSCYRRDLRGWWIATGLSVFFGLSNVVTNLRHTVADIYRVMNIPMPSTPLAALYSSMPFRVGFGTLFLVAYLGFLFYTKRYFPEPVEANQPLTPN